MTPEWIRCQRVADVAVVEIDNPPVNALATGMREQIRDGVLAAQGSGVVAVVVTGAARTFVGGADLRVFQALRTHEESVTRSTQVHRVLAEIEDSRIPVVAAIQGFALGGGLELAMSCHYRLAAEDAMVGQPEVRLGLIPGAGGTQRLPRLAGAAIALGLCTDGRRIPASEAAAVGIVDEVIGGDFRTASLAWARAVAAPRGPRRTRDRTEKTADVGAALSACAERRRTLGPAASQAQLSAIEAIEIGLTDGFTAGSRREIDLFARCLVSDESRDLVRRFFADRAAAKAAGEPRR